MPAPWGGARMRAVPLFSPVVSSVGVYGIWYVGYYPIMRPRPSLHLGVVRSFLSLDLPPRNALEDLERVPQEMASQVSLSFSVAMNNNDAAATTAAATQRKKVKTQKWRCDVCQVKTFLDIKECEAHEAICQAVVAAASRKKKVTTTADAVEPSPQLPPAFDKPPAPHPAKREQAEWVVVKKPNTKRQRTTKSNDAEEVVDVEKAGKKKQASSVHPFFQGAAKTSTAPQAATKKKPQKKSPPSKECTNNTANLTQDEAVKAPCRKTKTDENSLNTFFQGATAEEIKAMQAAQKSELDAKSTWMWNASGRAGKALRQDLPWLTLPVAKQQEQEESSFVWNTPMMGDQPLHKPCDLLLQSMDALFVPSTEHDGEESTMATSDVEELPEAGGELADFLEKWKEMRQEACRRMEERHAKLAGRKKKKSAQAAAKSWRKSKYEDDSDDYFFSGSESEDEENAITSLFLLTGNVGVGKTSLVYKIAKRADCGVLEVNTTEVRGAASLRKRIQEATQTHAANWNKKAGIASAFAPKEKPEKKVNAAALMVILLDEVDLLYPENGDNGFWNALSDVSKKAKAPIVLTANKIPEELLSPAFRYQHVHVESSLDRCATYLLSTAKRAGFCVRPERKDSAASDAECIAFLAKGDYRRISIALEALKATPKDVARKGVIDGRIEMLSRQTEKTNGTVTAPAEDEVPRISNIQPPCVPANQLSLITITGEGFLAFAEPPCLGASGGYPVTVRVGQRDCPQARILDDTTILAVCPPIIGENDTSVHLLSPGLHYADVSLSASKRTGLMSTTSGVQTRDELNDGTPWLTSQNVFLLEYRTGKHEQQAVVCNDEGSDEVFELDDLAPVRTAFSALLETDSKAALQIMSEGIGAWLSQNHEIPIVDEPDDLEDEIGLEMIEQVSRSADFESDAVFFEDCGLHGLPFLAGGSIPFDTVEKSTTMQFQRTQKQLPDSWYCGSDSFMIRPSPREGRLLTRIEQSLRGTCHRFAASEAEEEGCDTAIFREEPEDDVLLPRKTPNALLDLPGCLRSSSNTSFPPISWDFAFSSRQEDIWKEQLDFLERYAFAYNRADLKLFSRGLNRDIDCLLDSGDFFDDRLLLDYLPILRIIAVLERASDLFFDQQNDEEVVSNLSNRSRSTRAAAKRGREHFFETSFEYLKSLHDSEHAREVGKSFSQRYLGYY
eukprot:scaffold4162_cov162-Amphora_coffeaeformis.AAC.12